MKVYIVQALSANAYDNFSWPHSVYYTKEKAEAFIRGCGNTMQEADRDLFGEGWFVDKDVLEMEVQ
jgi:hypothetical protein